MNTEYQFLIEIFKIINEMKAYSCFIKLSINIFKIIEKTPNIFQKDYSTKNTLLKK